MCFKYFTPFYPTFDPNLDVF